MASDFIVSAYVRNGRSTVCRGTGVPDQTDETTKDFVQAIASGTAATGLNYLAHRFIYHGGSGGSGNWEH